MSKDEQIAALKAVLQEVAEVVASGGINVGALDPEYAGLGMCIPCQDIIDILQGEEPVVTQIFHDALLKTLGERNEFAAKADRADEQIAALQAQLAAIRYHDGMEESFQHVLDAAPSDVLARVKRETAEKAWDEGNDAVPRRMPMCPVCQDDGPVSVSAYGSGIAWRHDRDGSLICGGTSVQPVRIDRNPYRTEPTS